MRLPDFVIAGVAKAGTTSLHAYLASHPQVYTGDRKELNFLACGDPVVADGWPHLQFPITSWEQYQAYFDGAGPDQLAGEASPIYFESPLALKRIETHLPQVKVIISLRDPRERAYSGYLMHVREGHRPLSDEELVRPGSRFIDGGYYAETLSRYVDLLGDRLHVVLFDDLRRAPAGVIVELCRFLGLDPGAAVETGRAHNTASYPRSHRLNAWLTSPVIRDRVAPLAPRWLRRAGQWLLARNRGAPPRLSAELRARLTEVYLDDIGRVEALTGRDLSAWRQTPAQGA